MNQNKDYIEELIKKHFIQHNYTVGEYGETVDTYLSLLNKCDKDKYILESIIKVKSNINDYYIIGVGGDWNYIQIIYYYNDILYIGNFFRGPFMIDIKNNYLSKIREKTLNNLLYEKEV